MSKTTRELLQQETEYRAELRKILDENTGALSPEAEKRCADLKAKADAVHREAEYRAFLEEDAKASAKAAEIRSDFSSFSLSKAIASLADPKVDGGREREMSDELEHRGYVKTNPRSILVPATAFEKRTVTHLSSGALNSGRNLIADDFREDLFVSTLREANPLTRLGVTHVGGLVGDVTIPAGATNTAVAWLSADGEAFAETTATYRQIKATPHYVGAVTEVSLGLLKQGTPDVDKLLMNDLAQTLGLAVAKAAIVGTGSSGQPKGLLHADNSITAVVTPQLVVRYATACKQQLLTANADVSHVAYLVNSGLCSTVEGVVTTDGYPLPVEQVFRNRPFQYFSELPSAKILAAGDWRDLMICEWGAVELLVSEHVKFSTGGVGIRILQGLDICCRRTASFCTLGGVAASSGSDAGSGSNEGGNG